jgi:hypothetical protein
MFRRERLWRAQAAADTVPRTLSSRRRHKPCFVGTKTAFAHSLGMGRGAKPGAAGLFLRASVRIFTENDNVETYPRYNCVCGTDVIIGIRAVESADGG